MTQTTAIEVVGVSAIQKQFPLDKYNLLLPSQSTEVISPYQKVTLEALQVKTDARSGEVFKLATVQEDGKRVDAFGLTRVTIDKISHTVGISWINMKTLVDDPMRVVLQCIGVLKKGDGSYLTIEGTKEVDVEAIVEETRVKLEELAEDGRLKAYLPGKSGEQKLVSGSPECTRYINRKVTARRIEVRKHKYALAETGAKNRAVRRALALKPNYTEKELEKPFIIPRVDFNPDKAMEDPVLRQQLLNSAITASNQLYQNTHQAALPAGDGIPSDYIPVEESEPLPDMTITAEPDDTAVDGEPSAEDKKQMDMNIYREFSDTERLQVMENLIKAKNLTLAGGNPINLGQFIAKSLDVQMKNIEWAYDQPDPSAKSTDDNLPITE